MKHSFWSDDSAPADAYSLFRGRFRLTATAEVTVRAVGASWYQAWIDGAALLEGPFRFALDRPEYQIERLHLDAGEHVLAFHAHNIGKETRILKETAPFLWCRILVDDSPVAIDWRCLPLESQASLTRRINPQLGWIEWRDTRLEPVGWERPEFDDSEWSEPVWEASPLAEPGPADLAPVRTFVHPISAMAEGPLAHTFGYATDEPAFVFHSRDRSCEELPPKGVWRRYDLGRVRLGRPRFRLNVPAGAIVEMAMAESLMEGRVSPYVALSAGTSCNLDHYVARGGEQEFRPLTPKGGRFVEVHVIAPPGEVRFLGEEFLERGYHPPTQAAFSCGDPLLEKVWATGIETYRACAEDALVDNPTRERGQWMGDVASVGLELASVAYHDLRLCKRVLAQAALCPREDGLVAGMSPGGCIYLPTFAFQWSVAAVEYFRLTGDRSLLEELWPAALRNMDAIRAFRHEDGLHSVAGWNFVDWGYRTEDGPVDTACNLHYLWSLRAMARWAEAIGNDGSVFEAWEDSLQPLLSERIRRRLKPGWPNLGYHCAVLAMRLGLIEDERGCLDYLESHLLNCFPNHRDAPRNDDPAVFNSRLITPYFAHYAMPLFIERGRMDFVLGQYRACWGEYMLANGRTTWMEVFDTRWSHCHQWSGCPTWQMSRYLLGLHARCDRAVGDFDLYLAPGSLDHASGRIPHPAGGWIDIEWSRTGERVRYDLRTETPVRLLLSAGRVEKIESKRTLTLDVIPAGTPPSSISTASVLPLHSTH